MPFNGEDIWNAFEFSYLTQKGKPVVAIAVFRFPADSKFLIESMFCIKQTIDLKLINFSLRQIFQVVFIFFSSNKILFKGGSVTHSPKRS